MNAFKMKLKGSRGAFYHYGLLDFRISFLGPQTLNPKS